MGINNRINAHKASNKCWVLTGTEDDSPNYLLYAQALDDDWWEFVLAQIQQNIDVERDFFCFDTQIFRSKVYSRHALGIDSSLTNMARDLANDAVQIDNPLDFQEAFGGEIITFSIPEDKMDAPAWH